MSKKHKMDYCGDFIRYLEHDMSLKILMYLDNPADLVRVCLVSKFWREFVITNGLAKQLCLRMLPELSSSTHVIEDSNMIEPVVVRENTSAERDYLKRNHKVYAFLARAINPSIRKDCILQAVAASSTDNYPEESVENTLHSSDFEIQASYWSSEGKSDPAIPETLIYRLRSKMCLVSEIDIQPFQAYFQFGFPIYSSRAVRFRMGHSKFLSAYCLDNSADGDKWANDNLMWTYTSPEFPMSQENCLQKFKLPEPVLCIGGFLQIELLGRVQKQETDGLYYICVGHVQVVGRPLVSRFGITMQRSSGQCSLKYVPIKQPTDIGIGRSETSASWHLFTTRLMQSRIRHFLGNFQESDDEFPV